ncbi:hypothetical protein EV183_005000 [Coemansia sp. RSA 2336]|nr:hypothetical protein EV183_005000 [Coemansia sp. RSA 2336]
MEESKEHTSVTGALSDSSLAYTPISEIEEIFQQVRQGFVDGAARSFEQRKHHLRQLLRGLLEEKAALLDAVYFDIRKPHGETELFEFGALEYEIGLFLDNMERWARPTKNPMGSEQPAFLLSHGEVRKEPRGTVVVVGAWNFPIRILLLPVVGALAAGNTVVVKPSELSPHTAQAIARAVKHVDPHVLRVVQGAVDETTALLRLNFDHYFYTGNGRVGKLVAHAAAEHHAVVTLELGGKSPAIVHADVADLEPTAARIMWAKLSNAGQTCVGVDYLLVHRSVKDKLVPLLIDAAIGMFTASPATSPDFGRIVNGRHWSRLMGLLKRSRGNVIRITDDEPNENDRFIPPVLVDGVPLDDSLMSEELFGPILPIIAFDTLDEAIEIVNSGDKPLALYVFAQNRAADYVLARTQSGTATVNDTMLHLASHTNPFGGIGSSGVGNYTAKYSFDTFSHHRYVLKRPLWFPTPGIDTVRMPPFTGNENAWKTQLGIKMVYPKPRSLRTSFLSKLFTFLPFWRILAIIPGFIYALITTKSTFHQPKSKQ